MPTRQVFAELLLQKKRSYFISGYCSCYAWRNLWRLSI